MLFNSVYILGAGFSAYAGVPLGSGLFSEMRVCAESRSAYDLDVLMDHVNEFKNHRQHVYGLPVNEDEIDIEELISYFDLRQKLGLRGGLQPARGTAFELEPFQYWIRYILGLTLHVAQRRVSDESMEIYRKFASRLKPGDVVITFNYDTLLETALDKLRLPYRHYLFTSTDESWETAVSSACEIIILKMHGSIDWFDRANFEWCGRTESSLFPGDVCPLHPVFENGNLCRRPLIEPERFDGDPLAQVYRVSNLDDYYSGDDDPIPHDVPFIVSPSYYKLLYMNPLMEFWRGLMNTGSLKKRTVIIGYSLPKYDEYARIAVSLLCGSARSVPLSNFGKLKLVDYQKTAREIDELKQNYRFVHWDSTECNFDGFNMEAIKMIFDE